MAYELKDGQGSLFKNDRKEKESQPDFTGKLNIGGREYRLSAWTKESKSRYDKNGKPVKFLSLSVREGYEKEPF